MDAIFASICRGILGCIALPYFMGSMRKDRNQSLFLHFPHFHYPEPANLGNDPSPLPESIARPMLTNLGG